MKERVKLITGIALLVQALSMFVLFLSQLKKRRGLSAVFFGISAVSGLLGGKLIADAVEDEYEIPDIELGDEDEDVELDFADECEIDGEMLRADLDHGTDDEAQSI
jgi:hypothetical protein